jgi:ATP-dependent DNA helicase RecG
VATFDLENIPGIGINTKNKLLKLGISNSRDLCFHLPVSYQDKTKLQNICQLNHDDFGYIECEILNKKILYKPRKIMIINAISNGEKVSIKFFYFNPGMIKIFKEKNFVRLYGQIKNGLYGKEMIHPECEVVNKNTKISNTLTSIYRTVKGISQNKLRGFIKFSVQNIGDEDNDINLKKYGFDEINLSESLKEIHFPDKSIKKEDILPGGNHPARKRLIKEELLAFQLGMLSLKERRKKSKSRSYKSIGKWTKNIETNMPFNLTGSQHKVINEIKKDLAETSPMMRLVQGDVGSGKTAVALMAASLVADKSDQVALMAPTTILAEQHYLSTLNFFKGKESQIALLTGSTPSKERDKILNKLFLNEIKIIIGTHALFQKDVEYADLGLIIIDEQHRFGVNQRLALKSQNSNKKYIPHHLTLTATPIPRTLSMSIYANMSISIIDELPPGRKEITTTSMGMNKKNELIKRLNEACAQGSQAYWVCALVEESDVINANPIEETFNEINKNYPNLACEYIHGSMKADQKNIIINNFKNGITKLLIATTVIEVGVDVPNADIIVIENCERFGLAQLHQLRGRVGRGDKQSNCVLLHNENIGENAAKRIEVLKDTNDGFEIAEQDLEIRGPGEIMGQEQTGVVPFKYVDLVRDSKFIEESTDLAKQIISDDKKLTDKLIQRWLSGSIDYADA